MSAFFRLVKGVKLMKRILGLAGLTLAFSGTAAATDLGLTYDLSNLLAPTAPGRPTPPKNSCWCAVNPCAVRPSAASIQWPAISSRRHATNVRSHTASKSAGMQSRQGAEVQAPAPTPPVRHRLAHAQCSLANSTFGIASWSCARAAPL